MQLGQSWPEILREQFIYLFILVWLFLSDQISLALHRVVLIRHLELSLFFFFFPLILFWKRFCWIKAVKSLRLIVLYSFVLFFLTPSPYVALSLFLMSVNIKTPVVVENITLMCLRILQKLIKPPAPTSKKNKVKKNCCMFKIDKYKHICCVGYHLVVLCHLTKLCVFSV